MRASSAAEPLGQEQESVIQAVNRFFFSPADTATFGLIRITAALMTLYIHLVLSFDLYSLFGKDAWFPHAMARAFQQEMPYELPPQTWEVENKPPPPAKSSEEAAFIQRYQKEWGFHPYQIYARGQSIWSVWLHVTDPTWMAVIHAGILVAMLLFTLGLWTPVTGVITWLGALSYVSRAQTSLFGMDTMMIIALLYLAIGYLFIKPSANAFSLDRLLWRWRMQREGRGAEIAFHDTTSISVNFALRMMQIHFCIVYFGAGVSKLLGSSWWTGKALWGTVANYEFAPMNYRYYDEILTFIAQRRWLWEILMTSGVIYTLTLEIGFPFLVWVPRLRWLMVVGAVLLHTGIALFMGLTGFGVMMLALLFSFVPSDAVRRLFGSEAIPLPKPAV